MRSHLEKRYKDYIVLVMYVLSWLILYFGLTYVYLKFYVIKEISNPNIQFWDIFHIELPNIFTLLGFIPFVLPFLTNALVKKLNPQSSTSYNLICGFIFGLLIVFYRFANTLEMHRVIIALVGLGHFVLVVVVSLLYSFKKEKVIINKGVLLDTIGGIHNRKILSIQLFECEDLSTNDDKIIRMTNIDSVTSKYSDNVNSILKIQMKLPMKYYNQFDASRQIYQVHVKNGDEDSKKTFLKSITETKNEIVKELDRISYDDIKPEHCCLARLLLCLFSLEKMISEPNIANIDLDDGETGIDEKREKKLFSIFRTGMLGAYAFGSDHRYYFRYRREGIKIGRKYCAFMIDSNANSTRELCCLVTIREDESPRITKDVIDWISKAEKEICKNIDKF